MVAVERGLIDCDAERKRERITLAILSTRLQDGHGFFDKFLSRSCNGMSGNCRIEASGQEQPKGYRRDSSTGKNALGASVWTMTDELRETNKTNRTSTSIV